jgi:hypothetical protein
MDILRSILDAHEEKIQTIMRHKTIDWEKRHLAWKQATREWQRLGKEGMPYPEPELFPEHLVRKNNEIHFQANDLKRIYMQLLREREL